MNKLISMTDFVLQVEKYEHESHNTDRGFELINNYANFLKQPLKLEMFAPCDEDGNVLEKPCKDSYKDYYSGKFQIYQNAKGKVIFDGFKLNILTSNIIEFSKDFLIIRFHIKENSIFFSDQKKMKEIFKIEDLVNYNLYICNVF